MPNQPLFQLFQQTLHSSYQLLREKKRYSSIENNIPYSFISPSRRCYGFKLEYTNTRFFGSHPPPGIKKMCDAILIVHHKQVDYIILVEIKSNTTEHYKKQLVNGQYFCQWIVGLLKEYNHYVDNPQYIGLLIWQVNPNKVLKRTTAQNRKPFEEAEKHKDIRMFKSNKQNIYLKQLIAACDTQSTKP